MLFYLRVGWTFVLKDPGQLHFASVQNLKTFNALFCKFHLNSSNNNNAIYQEGPENKGAIKNITSLSGLLFHKNSMLINNTGSQWKVPLLQENKYFETQNISN